MLRTFSPFEKYKTNIDDIGGKSRYGPNILQWSKNDFKSKNNTIGDYSSSKNIILREKPEKGFIEI